MRTVLASSLVLALLTTAGLAQSYTAPAPTDVPSSGTKSLNKADCKIACTQEADRRNLRGLRRQQYRAACRNRPIPRG